MYKNIDGSLAISVNDWIAAGLTFNQFNHDSKKGFLKILRRGINGNTLIDVRSVKRPERLSVIESVYGTIEDKSTVVKSIYIVETDTRARAWFTDYIKPDGSHLDSEQIERYTDLASIFTTLRNGMRTQIEARARCGKRLKMKDFWRDMLVWYNQECVKRELPIYNNVRSLERAFKKFLNDEYTSLLHGNVGADNARKVSRSMENLFLSLWRTNDKPFIDTVHALYLEFVSGNKELFDRETGELYRPEDFRHKGRAIEVSVATIWNYLKDIVNNTAVYADRNGNFDYANSKRPKQNRARGKYSLSKISMDDVCLSRKSVRGFVYKYIAVDVVSGYYFRPAYVVGKPNAGTVYEAFRNMFCELSLMNLPMPGELEVEYHLMQDIKWLDEAFRFVRFCNSPTEKRVEHTNRQFKYGVSKREGHSRGRWYSQSEAYKSVRNKVSGDFVDPLFQPQTIVADDLSDIAKYNNELHPLQKTYPGMTRRDVLIQNFNPNLQPIDYWHLYKFIGNETQTSLYNNDYCPVAGDKFEICDFKSLKRLKPNNVEVTAYWLPEDDGTINKVYLYQGDTYIGEAINKAQFAYNECAIERTDEDEAKMLHQNKRLAKFDAFIKERRQELVKVESQSTQIAKEIANVPKDIVETEQPKGCEYDDNEDYSNITNINWGQKGVASV